MHIFLIRIISIMVFSFFNLTAYGQYDLDSLYENDTEFKSQFDAIRSTYSIFDADEPLKVTLRSDLKNIISFR